MMLSSFSPSARGVLGFLPSVAIILAGTFPGGGGGIQGAEARALLEARTLLTEGGGGRTGYGRYHDALEQDSRDSRILYYECSTIENTWSDTTRCSWTQHRLCQRRRPSR